MKEQIRQIHADVSELDTLGPERAGALIGLTSTIRMGLRNPDPNGPQGIVQKARSSTLSVIDLFAVGASLVGTAVEEIQRQEGFSQQERDLLLVAMGDYLAIALKTIKEKGFAD